jgi:putrescine transport system ATP-binding protein
MLTRGAPTTPAPHAEAGLQRDQRVHAWWDGSDVVVLTR